MIGVVGAPTQRQLREITRPDDDSAIELVRKVEQQLGALAGLDVLEHDVVEVGIVPKIFEMLIDGGVDVHLSQSHFRCADECIHCGSSVRAGAWTGHGERVQLLAIEFHQIEGVQTHEKRECGIETSRQPDDERFRACRLHSARQAGALNRENLARARIELVLVVGHEGMLRITTAQLRE